MCDTTLTQENVVFEPKDFNSMEVVDSLIFPEEKLSSIVSGVDKNMAAIGMISACNKCTEGGMTTFDLRLNLESGQAAILLTCSFCGHKELLILRKELFSEFYNLMNGK